MSKRKLKRQKKISTPLIAAMIAGVLLIAAAIFIAFGEQDGGGTPRLVVDQERIDYGDVAYDTPKTFTLRVTNTGDGTLRFREKPYVQVLEGC